MLLKVHFTNIMFSLDKGITLLYFIWTCISLKVSIEINDFIYISFDLDFFFCKIFPIY